MESNNARVTLIHIDPFNPNSIAKDYNNELEEIRENLENHINMLLNDFKEKYKLVNVSFKDEELHIIVDVASSIY